jgi:hypothetical protein
MRRSRAHQLRPPSSEISAVACEPFLGVCVGIGEHPRAEGSGRCMSSVVALPLAGLLRDWIRPARRTQSGLVECDALLRESDVLNVGQRVRPLGRIGRSHDPRTMCAKAKERGLTTPAVRFAQSGAAPESTLECECLRTGAEFSCTGSHILPKVCLFLQAMSFAGALLAADSGAARISERKVPKSNNSPSRMISGGYICA